MRSFRWVVLSCVLIVILGGSVYALVQANAARRVRASVSISDALNAGELEGFVRADAPRDFIFPDDHGAHPDYKIEWWYYTGNVETAAGRRFGYQFTVFRNALVPTPPTRESDWATNDVYMAHFALTDAESGDFYAFERYARGAAGLAGARAEPYRVWVEDWEASGTAPTRLRVETDDIAIDLSLTPLKPVAPHGDGGLSRKSSVSDAASYYYSYTRTATTGTLRVADERFEVAGLSWIDREWSSGVLDEAQVGWDWFSAHFSDETELMWFRLREADGSDSYANGTWIESDGSTERLAADRFAVESLSAWKSPLDGTRYPSKWRLRLPDKSLDVAMTPLIPNQELNLSMRYWEGSVRIEGERDGAPITGWGYVELTGYADAPPET